MNCKISKSFHAEGITTIRAAHSPNTKLTCCGLFVRFLLIKLQRTMKKDAKLWKELRIIAAFHEAADKTVITQIKRYRILVMRRSAVRVCSPARKKARKSKVSGLFSCPGIYPLSKLQMVPINEVWFRRKADLTEQIWAYQGILSSVKVGLWHFMQKWRGI